MMAGGGDVLSIVIQSGSFGLVAWLVIGQFRRLDQWMQRQAEQQAELARVLAELTMQIARISSAPGDMPAHFSRSLVERRKRERKDNEAESF